ncbi:MAG: hypothetical protein HZA12_02760, partial [Nitrospirae bacterium]|nr:hypothetical protein [Nitrospirota bacterium]
MGNYKRLGEMLVDEGVINEDVVKSVIEEQRHTHIRFGEILVGRRLMSGDDIARALSMQYRLEYADVNRLSIMSGVFSFIPESMAKRHMIIPVRVENKTLIIVVSDPLNVEGIKEVEFYSGMKVHPMVGARDAIIEAIKYNYRFDNFIENIASVSSSEVYTTDADKEEIAAPIINLVNMLLSEAVENRASDIHI